MDTRNHELADNLKALKKSYKPKYSKSAWEERESLYVDCLHDMDIPANPLPIDIKEIIHVSDILFTQVKLDYAHTKRQLDDFEDKLYVQKKIYSIKFRENGEAKSDLMAKSLAVQYISKKIVLDRKKDSYSLLDLISLTKIRLTFIESIIAIITAKQRVLITESGVMKLEGSFDGDPK